VQRSGTRGSGSREAPGSRVQSAPFGAAYVPATCGAGSDSETRVACGGPFGYALWSLSGFDGWLHRLGLLEIRICCLEFGTSGHMDLAEAADCRKWALALCSGRAS
jgi:hypothetical protein